MDIIKQQQTLAEETVKFLREQLNILKPLAEKKQKGPEQEEIDRLTAENEKLASQILSLKKDLRFYESQNGVKQVKVPQQKISKSVDEQPDVPGKSGEIKTEQVSKANEDKGKEKKPKKENKHKNQGKAKPQDNKSNASGDKPVDISRVLMKVGKIIDVKAHPDADRLYVEQVDVGEEKPRTIISGLREHIPIESMKGKVAIFMCNLKPQKMCGILSEGMIMCGVKPDVKTEIIEVPANAQVGDQVVCPDYRGVADVQLPPKKKIWEQVQPLLRIDENGIPVYKGSPFTILGKEGKIYVPTLKDCMIR